MLRKTKSTLPTPAGINIITVGLSPCWDITCRAPGLNWSCHQKLTSQTSQPAGKALNVSRALAHREIPSTAAGLWGRADYPQMRQNLKSLAPLLNLCMTTAPGSTRQNITLIDTSRCREMHLRAPALLLNRKSLRQLHNQLTKIITPNCFCVFSGSIPHNENFPHVIELIESCRDLGARLVIDSSGPALHKIVALGGIYLIKPNLEELNELLGRSIPDKPAALAGAARSFTSQVQTILISRGPKGALVVTKNSAWRARCPLAANSAVPTAISTVGCGDHLLAGFLRGKYLNLSLKKSLESALQSATAHAWGLNNRHDFQQINQKIKIELNAIK
ncbi:MAG: hypothetical protein JXD22_06775 [Sedimentisphaerales bacterium]|nr:hypothetical protein [Sedimentisphaerales bacterium]